MPTVSYPDGKGGWIAFGSEEHKERQIRREVLKAKRRAERSKLRADAGWTELPGGTPVDPYGWTPSSPWPASVYKSRYEQGKPLPTFKGKPYGNYGSLVNGTVPRENIKGLSKVEPTIEDRLANIELLLESLLDEE